MFMSIDSYCCLDFRVSENYGFTFEQEKQNQWTKLESVDIFPKSVDKNPNQWTILTNQWTKSKFSGQILKSVDRFF